MIKKKSSLHITIKIQKPLNQFTVTPRITNYYDLPSSLFIAVFEV